MRGDARRGYTGQRGQGRKARGNQASAMMSRLNFMSQTGTATVGRSWRGKSWRDLLLSCVSSNLLPRIEVLSHPVYVMTMAITRDVKSVTRGTSGVAIYIN